jgi:hypothetical protein
LIFIAFVQQRYIIPSMKKLIPDLAVDGAVAEYGEVFGIDSKRIPDASNEIAAILLANNFQLRSCGAALARVLGWLAFQARNDIEPGEFLKAVTDQGLNYCGAFSARSERE